MPNSGPTTDFHGQNYLPAKNPFQMVAPPLWWLRKLWEYDRELVMLPGLTECVYRVARRSPHGRTLTPLANESETQRLWEHGLVPVTSLVPWTAWNDDFFQWLRDHDTWALKGRERAGDAAADRLDELDAIRHSRIDAAAQSTLEARNVSAYDAFKRRTGQTVTLSQPATPLH